jgi:hypothetical protein
MELSKRTRELLATPAIGSPLKKMYSDYVSDYTQRQLISFDHLDLPGIAAVGLHKYGITACGYDGVGNCLTLFRASCGADDFHAVFTVYSGNGLSDTAACSCDNHYFSCNT